MKTNNILIDTLYLNIDTGPWVAGGAARAWYLGQDVDLSDIDIYCANSKQYNEVLHHFGLDDTIMYSPKHNITVICDSVNAKTLLTPRDENHQESIRRPVQIIKQFFDSAQDVINNFDITVCQVITDRKTFLLGEHTENHIKNKILQFYTLYKTSIPRLIKYWTYGFEPSSDTMDLIMLSIANSEQCLDFTGVDGYAH